MAEKEENISRSAVPELDDGGDDIQRQGQPSEANCQPKYDLRVEVTKGVIALLLLTILVV